MVVFDPVKDKANIAKHGVSLGRAETMFVDDALIEIDDRRDYGSRDGSFTERSTGAFMSWPSRSDRESRERSA